MAGTRVTCTDIETGESESVVIENNYVIVTDGDTYLDGEVRYSTGTSVITIKRKAVAPVSVPEARARPSG